MKLWVEKGTVTLRLYLLLQVSSLILKIPLCLKKSASTTAPLQHYSLVYCVFLDTPIPDLGVLATTDAL